MTDSSAHELLIRISEQNEKLTEQNANLKSESEKRKEEQADHFNKYNLAVEGLASNLNRIKRFVSLFIVTCILIGMILIWMGMTILSSHKVQKLFEVRMQNLEARKISTVVLGKRVLPFAQAPGLYAIQKKEKGALIVSAGELAQCPAMCKSGPGREFITEYIPYRNGLLNAASDLNPGPELTNPQIFASVSGIRYEGDNNVPVWNHNYIVETEAKSNCFRVHVKVDGDTHLDTMYIDWIAVGE